MISGSAAEPESAAFNGVHIGSMRPGTTAEVVVEVHLGNPITGHRDVIKTLFVRHINMGDWCDIGPVVRRYEYAGNPDGSEAKVETVEDPNRLMRWMCRLTGQQEAILRQLRGKDASAVAAEIKMMVIEFAVGKSRSDLLNWSASSE